MSKYSEVPYSAIRGVEKDGHWDTPRVNAGQIVEVSYLAFGRTEECEGSAFKRVWDHGDNSKTYYVNRQWAEQRLEAATEEEAEALKDYPAKQAAYHACEVVKDKGTHTEVSYNDPGGRKWQAYQAASARIDEARRKIADLKSWLPFLKAESMK